MHLNTLKTTIPFPTTWNMDEWNSVGVAPVPVQIIARDPYEVIAYKLIDPTLQYGWKDSILYESTLIHVGDNIECSNDLMTTSWARCTEANVRRFVPDAILIPLIIYGDGVTMGLRGNAKATPALATMGNFSDELQQRDISKMALGYLPDLKYLNKEELLNHLVKQGIGATKAANEIVKFGRHIENEFWRIVLKSLITFENVGVPMYILGKGVKQVVIRLAFACGDDPALHRFCSIKEGKFTSLYI